MKTFVERENGDVRLIIEFMSSEKPKVTDILRGVIKDLKSIKYYRDILTQKDKNDMFYAEVFINEKNLRNLRLTT